MILCRADFPRARITRASPCMPQCRLYINCPVPCLVRIAPALFLPPASISLLFPLAIASFRHLLPLAIASFRHLHPSAFASFRHLHPSAIASFRHLLLSAICIHQPSASFSHPLLSHQSAGTPKQLYAAAMRPPFIARYAMPITLQS